jgi:hypothetical protein
MKLLVNPSKPFLVDVGVNLRGGYIHMSEHLLHTSQIRSTGQKMGRKAVPQCVNGQISRHSRASGVFLD